MNKIKVHCYQDSKDVTCYIFTKSKNECVSVMYDKTLDFGKSFSGVHLSEIEIYYNNSIIKDKLTEVKIEEVPKCIIDLLTYLQ